MTTSQCTTSADTLATSGGICDLPLELVIGIFSLYTPSSRTDIRTTHVCRFLRAAVHATPEFWVGMLAVPNVIKYDDSEDAFWLSFLPRTGLLPLALSVTVIRDTAHRVTSLLPAKYHARIASLTFDLRNIRRGVALQMLPSLAGLPGLASLRCTTTAEAGCMNPSLRALDHLIRADPTGITLSRMVLNLRILEIPLTLFDAGLIVPSLRTLVLGAGRYHIPTLLCALRECPSLEIFKLVVPFPRAIEITGPINNMTISLPHLKEWIVKWGLVPIFHTMIQHIVCAPTTHLQATMRTVSLGWLLSVFDTSGPSPFPVFLNNLDALSVRLRLAKELSERDVHVKGYVGDTERMSILVLGARWSIQRAHRGPSYVLYDLAAIFGPIQSITSLRFDFEQCVAVVQHDWTRLFDAFPNLCNLAVTIKSCKNLFRALQEHPFLPPLEKLEVSCWNGSGPHELIVSAIEHRTSSGLPLKQFTFRHLNETTRISDARLARLKAVVSRVVVS